MSTRNICVVTGTRAEYGLLYRLIESIYNDPELKLQLLVTGMHLSSEFGLTWKQIEQDGFPIERKIEVLLSSDSEVGISKSIGLGQISFAETFSQIKPDLVVVLGDRTEIFAAATAALIAGIPIAHIHGGEETEGAYDNAIRHSITKMSHLHFATTELYRQRIIQMGESPECVYNVGALGVENIKKLNLLSRIDFEKSISRKLLSKNLLITFHPVTLEDNTAGKQFNQLLNALDDLDDTLLIFTKPNSDKDGRIIIRLIDQYVEENPQKAIAFTSLGQIRYLSAIQYMDAVVGNSSSGIIEVPEFDVPTVNIGDRQKGRMMSESIFNCIPKKEAINKALYKAFHFDKAVAIDRHYGDNNVSDNILKIIKETDEINLKKTFYVKFS